MFGVVLIPTLVAVDQNILQQNKCVGPIQKQSSFIFRLFCKHCQIRFFLKNTDYSSFELNDSHWPLLQTFVILTSLNSRRVWIKGGKRTINNDLHSKSEHVEWWETKILSLF